MEPEPEIEPGPDKAAESPSLMAGMAALRFASKAKRRIAVAAENRRKDGHNKRDTVSVDKQVSLVQEQLEDLDEKTDLHSILTVIGAARYLGQKHMSTNIDDTARKIEMKLRSVNPELGKKMDLRNSPGIRNTIRRLWDLLLVESSAMSSTREVAIEAYCSFHCCIGKAISADGDEWSREEAIEVAKLDWADDVARFSNDATINTWFARVKAILQKRSQEAVMQAGWKALFKLIDTDGSGALDCDEFTAALRKSGITPDTISDLDLRRTFQSVDKDGSGEVDGAEFAAWLVGLEQQAATAEERGQQLSRPTKALMKCMSAIMDASGAQVASLGWDELFSRFDKDGSGGLDSAEFCAAVRSECGVTSEEVADSDLQEIFSMIDDDNSGVLSADEFSKALRKDENEDYTMTFAAFEASMFELVDYWSHGVSEQDYISFFRAVFQKIATQMPGIVGYDEPVLKSTKVRDSTDGENYNYRLKKADVVVASVDDTGKFDLGELSPPPAPAPEPPKRKPKKITKLASLKKPVPAPEPEPEPEPEEPAFEPWEPMPREPTPPKPEPVSPPAPRPKPKAPLVAPEPSPRVAPRQTTPSPPPQRTARKKSPRSSPNRSRQLYPTHHVHAPAQPKQPAAAARVPDWNCLANGSSPRLRPVFTPARAPAKLLALEGRSSQQTVLKEPITPTRDGSTPLHLREYDRSSLGGTPTSSSRTDLGYPRTATAPDRRLRPPPRSRPTMWVALPGMDVVVPVDVDAPEDAPESPMAASPPPRTQGRKKPRRSWNGTMDHAYSQRQMSSRVERQLRSPRLRPLPTHRVAGSASWGVVHEQPAPSQAWRGTRVVYNWRAGDSRVGRPATSSVSTSRF